MKKILGILAGIVFLLIVAGAVLVFVTPSEFKVEREIVINKARPDVYDYAKMLKNQNEWGPWVKKDPEIKLSYKGTDGEAGFVSSWESKNEEVGSGEQEIKKLTDGYRIDTEIRFKDPFESTSEAYLVLEEAGSTQTKVKWGFTGSMPKPWNLMLLFVDMDKEVGRDFDKGLGSLKAILEKQ